MQYVWTRVHAAQVNRQRELDPLGQTNTPTESLFWLAALRDQSATDPRDKVYAALGLAQVYGESHHSRVYDFNALIVDYTASIQSVYSSLVNHL